MSIMRPNHGVTFAEALRAWIKISLLSFGGPAGQIAVMHRTLVEEKQWVSESRFLHALNYCMLLPGPEAQQLVTYTGWLLHGWRGGLVAGSLFVLPGFLAILILSVVYAGFQGFTIVSAIFFGLKPAVMAIVVEAVIRIGRKALSNAAMVFLAAAAFVALFFFDVPFPAVILCAGAVGLVGNRLWPAMFKGSRGHQAAADANRKGSALSEFEAEAICPQLGRSLRVLALWLSLWFIPLILIGLVLGSSHVFVQEGMFFSKAAMVTFGGAYAVLAYIAQQAVETYGWLRPGEMMDGLGMAETTPGPLIQVVQFVGFMAAYRNPGMFDPMAAGILGSVIVTWVTFTPCFLWIFLGAPYIEYLRGNKIMASALSAITATVVGVILNLAVWFSLHTIFGKVDELHFGGVRLYMPNISTIDPASAVIAIGAFIATLRFKAGMFKTLAGSVAVGALWYMLLR